VDPSLRGGAEVTAKKQPAKKPARKQPAMKPAAPDDVEQLLEDPVPDDLRTAARAALGVDGTSDASSLRKVLGRTGAGWYPLLALGALVAIDGWQGVAFGVLGPDIAHSLGLSKAGVTALVSLKLLTLSLATLPMAAFVQNRPRRALVAIVCAIGWAVITLYTGFVTGIIALLVVLVLDGATSGSVGAVHMPLLMDSYPPAARVRATSLYRAFETAGGVVAPLLIAFLSSVLFLTWRGVFLVMGVVSLIVSVLSVRLRDPGFGHWDTGRIREMVREDTSDDGRAQLEDSTQLGFFEVFRRLMLIPTVRRILASSAVLGVMIVPFTTFQAFFLEERWGLDAGARGLFAGAGAAVGIVGLALFGGIGERLYREDPARLVRLSAWMLIAAIACIVGGSVAPVFALMLIGYGAAGVFILALGPGMGIALLAIIPATMRPHAAALSGIYLAGVGGVGGALLLGTVDRRFGTGGALVSIAIPGVIGALLLRSCASTIMADLDRTIDDVVEEEEIRKISTSGQQLPLLACRNIDFSYGQLQVLFGVDFTVETGEMVALLGVNGAGKSTLLRVISGLGLPTRGSVRLHGVDVTYLDAERRTALGINQIPGGRAVFGPLTVTENLRLFGYTLGRSKKVLDSSLDVAFEAFPRLAERRNQVAATLSGGEQQMLALCKARMLRPQLLLIDELSLGLAPTVVAQLLEMVRTINAEGTAVVLVEQSVNIALSLVEHAYFMEKGEIRFDGSAQDLLTRDELLRAVFLTGASAKDGTR
jgi:ABC-type branched-subunit amino acid transport system ATPase component/sugar phosphate permease